MPRRWRLALALSRELVSPAEGGGPEGSFASSGNGSGTGSLGTLDGDGYGVATFVAPALLLWGLDQNIELDSQLMEEDIKTK